MSQDLLEQKELWNVGAGATTTTIPMVTQSGLSVALSAASQNQLVGSTFDCAIGATRCMAVVNSVSASGVLTLDSPLPSVPAQGTQFVLTPTREMSLAGRNPTETQLFNAFVITDTNGHDSSYIQDTGGRKTLLYSSTLNQSVQLQLMAKNVSGSIFGLGRVTIAASTGLAVTGDVTANVGSIPELQEPWHLVGVRVFAGTAPTSGSISVWMEMNSI